MVMKHARRYGHTYALLFLWLIISLAALPEKAAWVSLMACAVVVTGTGVSQQRSASKTPPAPLPPHDPDDCPECGAPKLFTTCQALGCPAWCCWVCLTGPCDWEFDPEKGSCAMALAGEPDVVRSRRPVD